MMFVAVSCGCNACFSFVCFYQGKRWMSSMSWMAWPSLSRVQLPAMWLLSAWACESSACVHALPFGLPTAMVTLLDFLGAIFHALLQAKAVGSDFLWRRVQQLAPQMHVFGHSHFAWDAEIEGKPCLVNLFESTWTLLAQAHGECYVKTTVKWSGKGGLETGVEEGYGRPGAGGWRWGPVKWERGCREGGVTTSGVWKEGDGIVSCLCLGLWLGSLQSRKTCRWAELA